MFLYKIIVSCILKNDQDSVAADSLLQLKRRRGYPPRRCCRHDVGLSHRLSHNYNHSCNHSNCDHNDVSIQKKRFLALFEHFQLVFNLLWTHTLFWSSFRIKLCNAIQFSTVLMLFLMFVFRK